MFFFADVSPHSLLRVDGDWVLLTMAPEAGRGKDRDRDDIDRYTAVE